MATIFGFGQPFFGGPQRVLSRQEDEQLVKNDLLQLLLTVPGERVMRRDFGVNLRNAVFEQLDDVSLISLQSEIRSQIARHEPRVIVETLTLTKSDVRASHLDIRLVVRLKKDPTRLMTIERLIAIS